MFGSIGPAALVILAVNIAIGIVGLGRDPRIIEACLFRPWEFARGRRRYTLVTSGFAHADVPHLLFNMITFFFFGRPLERLLGTPKFVVLYALGLVLSPLISLARHRNCPSYATLGASGAVSAVVFAFIMYFPPQSMILFPVPIPIPAWLFAIAYLAYSIWSSRNSMNRINHDAHLAGALTGIVFVAVTDPYVVLRLLRMFGL